MFLVSVEVLSSESQQAGCCTQLEMSDTPFYFTATCKPDRLY